MNQSLFVCAANDSVRSLAERVRRESIPVFFVVSADSELEGIATRQAILSASWLHPTASIGDIMSTNLIYCEPNEAPENAAYLLVRSGAPVVLVEEGGEILGWIAPHDLARLSRLGPLRIRERHVPEGYGHVA